MKGNGIDTSVLIIIAFVGIMICLIFNADTESSRCMEKGCNDEPTTGSSYCFFHKLAMINNSNKLKWAIQYGYKFLHTLTIYDIN